MQLDADACYRAIRTRDERFDGRFFVCVSTTGIYCRPVCPALPPKRQNCHFVFHAAAAQEAGYRPCLRCRPEAAPGSPAWLGTSATVGRALRLIEEGALDAAGVGALAERLGIGERHLRRLFAEHVGASPKSVGDTRRLLFAKKLIDETDLSMTEIALSAGFGSVRRFNTVIKQTYGRAPRTLRGSGAGDAIASCDAKGSGQAVRLCLPYRPPLDWDALLGFLALRAIPGVEHVADGRYCRSLRLAHGAGFVEVSSPRGGGSFLEARIRLPDTRELMGVHQRLRRLFDLSADPAVIADALGGEPELRPGLAAHPGLRVPGAFDGFELAVRAVLGQQVSVRSATTLARRIVEGFGERLPDEWTAATEGRARFLFPTAAALADADLSGLGLTGVRARCIRDLARSVRDGAVTLEPGTDPEQTRAALRAIDGIGDWTAQYIVMRALAEPDAFLASDLVLRKRMARNGRTPSPAELRSIAEAWRPWRSYAVLCLWQDA